MVKLQKIEEKSPKNRTSVPVIKESLNAGTKTKLSLSINQEE